MPHAVKRKINVRIVPNIGKLSRSHCKINSAAATLIIGGNDQMSRGSATLSAEAVTEWVELSSLWEKVSIRRR